MALASSRLPVATVATSHLVPGTAIWACGLGEGPASHLPAWSWLLPKGSGAPVGAGAAGGGVGGGSLAWAGFQAPSCCGESGSPQLPALILPAHTTQGPGERKLSLSVGLATTRTAV